MEFVVIVSLTIYYKVINGVCIGGSYRLLGEYKEIEINLLRYVSFVSS